MNKTELKKQVFEIFTKCWKDSEAEVEITEGYTFDYLDTLNKIELYRASKFRSGDRNSEGEKKYFFNILNPQAGNATKNIDLDQKDIMIRSQDGEDRLKAMILREEFFRWAGKHELGELLNEIAEQLPVYGHIVLRKRGDEIERVKLRDFRCDQGVDELEDSAYIICKYYMQPYELEEMASKGWDQAAIARVNEQYRTDKYAKSSITVYEIFTEAPNKLFGKKGTGYSRGVFYVATNQDDYEVAGDYPGFQEILYATTVKEYPFKECKYISIDGRWLGLGIYELGFDAQMRWNEMANQKAMSMKLSSKHILQTKDNTVQQNIMTDMLDGDIVKVKSEITPIALEERNLAAYAQEENNVMNVLRNLTNAQEVLTGESMPSGTPFRLGALMNQNASKLFEFIRENLGLFLQEVIKEWVFPMFTPTVLAEHILEIRDSELMEKVLERDVNARLNEGIKKYVLKNGTYPPQQVVDAMKSLMMEQKDKTEFAKIAADYLKFDYDIDVEITGEKYNMMQRVETTNNLLQLLAQNPTILDNPATRKLLDRLLEDVGISASTISSKSGGNNPMQPSLGQVAVGPGSAATPPLASNPMAQ